jgi:uncharacterized phiE125 gp8 family phage protein
MALTLVTGPAAEPVSVSEAKSHLRVDIADDDTLIGTLITAARVHVEQHVKRALVSQTWDLVLNRFPPGPEIRLPLPPLASVTSISYTDEDGGAGVVSSSDYVVDTDREPGRVVLKNGKAWPAVILREAAGVRVRFVAGYGAAAAVPVPIKQAILLLVGTLYENREDTLVAQGVTVMRIPFGVEALLMPYRVIRV